MKYPNLMEIIEIAITPENGTYHKDNMEELELIAKDLSKEDKRNIALGNLLKWKKYLDNNEYDKLKPVKIDDFLQDIL